mgnify:CR=1 FL=1
MRNILFFLTLLSATHTYGQGDGPRAYWPAPKGTDIMSSLYLHVNSNSAFDNTFFVKDAEFDTDMFGLMYTRVFDVAGHTAAVVAMISGGSLSGGIDNIYTGETSGLADTYVIGVFNLTGAPSVTVEEYMKTNYDVVIDVIAAFRAPTGSYEADRNLNIGTNRWEFKFGFPMMKFFNWGTPKVTSIELFPSISFFTNNNDLADPNASLSQSALFNIEGHVTRKLSKLFWASLDYQYRYGGRTSIEEVKNDNLINSLSLGGSVGADFNPKFGAYITYGGVVLNNENGLDGNLLKLICSFKF